MELRPAFLPKNRNGGFYAPGKTYDLTKKLEVYQCYCELVDESFPNRPSVRTVAKKARVGVAFAHHSKLFLRWEAHAGYLFGNNFCFLCSHLFQIDNIFAAELGRIRIIFKAVPTFIWMAHLGPIPVLQIDKDFIQIGSIHYSKSNGKRPCWWEAVQELECQHISVCTTLKLIHQQEVARSSTSISSTFTNVTKWCCSTSTTTNCSQWLIVDGTLSTLSQFCFKGPPGLSNLLIRIAIVWDYRSNSMLQYYTQYYSTPRGLKKWKMLHFVAWRRDSTERNTSKQDSIHVALVGTILPLHEASSSSRQGLHFLVAYCTYQTDPKGAYGIHVLEYISILA